MEERGEGGMKEGGEGGMKEGGEGGVKEGGEGGMKEGGRGWGMMVNITRLPKEMRGGARPLLNPPLQDNAQHHTLVFLQPSRRPVTLSRTSTQANE